jgi:uncharacterized protein YecT (DUF1311 family)
MEEVIGVWKPFSVLAAVAVVLLLPATTRAQEANCAEPATQIDMNLCADRAWKLADEDLNLAYGFAKEMMATIDAGLPSDEQGAAKALTEAQRAWISFRDAGCAAEGFRVRGGSMEPMVVGQCLERVTRARTEELRSLGETW